MAPCTSLYVAVLVSLMVRKGKSVRTVFDRRFSDMMKANVYFVNMRRQGYVCGMYKSGHQIVVRSWGRKRGY